MVGIKAFCLAALLFVAPEFVAASPANRWTTTSTSSHKSTSTSSTHTSSSTSSTHTSSSTSSSQTTSSTSSSSHTPTSTSTSSLTSRTSSSSSTSSTSRSTSSTSSSSTTSNTSSSTSSTSSSSSTSSTSSSSSSSSTSSPSSSSSTSSSSLTSSTSSSSTTSSTSSPQTTASCTTSSNPAYQSFYVNYNFENVGNGDITPAAVEPIDETDGLYFGYINLIDETVQPLGVPAATLPNCAAFQASISLEDSLTDGPAYITAAYTESSISFFNAIQWFYGCVLPSEENEASLPVSCTITATGYNSAGTQVASQEFDYFVVDGTLEQDMDFAMFNCDFQNLYSMNLTVTNNATTAALFDNFIALLFQIPSAVFYPTP